MQRRRPSNQNTSGSEHLTRSEQARQRRDTRRAPAGATTARHGSRKPSAGRSLLSRASVPQSPVLVRRGRVASTESAFGSEAAVRRPGRSKARRRYDISLPVPGAEIRLPSMPALAFSWRIASGALVIMMMAALYFLLYSPAFKVSAVEVTGLKRLKLDDLYPVLALSGEAIVNVDPQVVQERLIQAFPDFSTVQVSISLPARVNLFVIERQPVIDWVTQNQDQWVDVQGFAFPPRGQVEGLMKVEADGTPQPVQVKTSASSEITPVSFLGMALPQPNTPLLPADLISTILSMRRYLPDSSVLLYSSEHGLGWNDPGGWQVYFGRQLADMDQKLLVYQAVVNKLSKDGVTPSFISVEYIHAPYYRVGR